MKTILTKDQENTLQVSQFLTTFQRFFREEGQQQRIISPNDVERATEYRMQLMSHYELQNEVAISQTEGWLSERERDNLDSKLQDSQEAIDGISTEIKEVHDVLRRFEIRCTKAIAAKTLIHCGPAPQLSNSPTQDDWICSSPLLNIPGPNYFSRILPLFPESEVHRLDSDGDGADSPRIRLPYNEADGVSPPIHPCSLMLPPNAWTWQEFARITNMMSLLPNNEARDSVLQSTLTGASPLVMPRSRNIRVRDPLKLSENAVFTPADLVALWVRSLRNTGALLHLLHLFEIKQVGETGGDEDNDEKRRWRIEKNRGIGGKVLRPRPDGEGQESEDDPSCDKGTANRADAPFQFRARYQGNHRWTKKLVKESAPQIDEAVSWATTNQNSCTDPYIRRKLSKDIIKCTKHTHKRTRQHDVQQDDPLPKRVKTSTEDSLDELLLSCQTYILRWFARRHRESLSAVFTSDVTGDDQDTLDEIQKHVRGYIRQHHGSEMAKNRTFARIDRRTLFGVFTNEGRLTFQETVLVLLEALVSAKAITSDVIEDFKSLCTAFLDGMDGETAAKALLETSGGSSNPADTTALLISAPTPWVDRCSGAECSRTIDDEHLVCDICELSYHPECGGTPARRKLFEIVALFPRLRDLFPLVIPENANPPDFRGMEDWSSYEMRIERHSSEEIGLDIRQTEHCEAWLRQFLSRCIPSGELLNDSSIGINPLAIDQQGILLVNVAKGSPGERAGLKKNDIITKIRLDSDGNWRLLRDMSAEDRVDLMDHDSFAVQVKRPAKNIVRLSSRWVNRIKQATESVSWKPKHKRKLYCCAFCQARGDTAEQFAGKQLDSVRKEALWSRAIIRRLGMESFALSFHDESPEDIADMISATEYRGDRFRHAMFVSLRRLDSMMEYIFVKGQDAKRAAELASAFDVPSWAGSSVARNNESRRLDWAKVELESKPLELLCKGVELLLTPVDAQRDNIVNERAQLRDRFSLLFTAWCLSAIGGANGPPAYALHMRPPWLKPSCTACHVRSSAREVPCADSLPGEVCDAEDCLKLLQANSTADDQTLEKGGDTASQFKAELLALDRYSSLVGTLLFVLPDDPLIEVLASELNQSVETMDRPFTFLLASYLPVRFSWAHKTTTDADGVFHVVPILGADQLRTLSNKYQMRRPPVVDTTDHESWTRLELLDLPGVIQMSPSEVELLMQKSRAIIGAVYAEVARNASSSDADVINTAALLADTDKGTGQHEATRLLQHTTYEVNQGSLAGQRALLCENLSSSDCPYFHDMVSIVTRSGTDLMLDSDKDNLGSNGEQHDVLTDIEDCSEESVRSAPEQGNFPGEIDISEDINIYRESLLASLGGSTVRPSVLYGDLVGHSPNETRAMQAIVKSIALRPPALPRSFSDHTILLDPNAYAHSIAGDQWIPPYNGNGWGFEILDWGKGYQVGRVYPRSLAFLAGLKMHDFIVAIAGVRTSQFTKWKYLASAILSPTASDLKCAGDKYPLRQSLRLLEKMKGPLQPVVLTVRRGVARPHAATAAVAAVSDDAEAPIVDLTGADDGDDTENPMLLHSQRPNLAPRPHQARRDDVEMPGPVPLRDVVQRQGGEPAPGPILHPVPQQVPQPFVQRNPVIPDRLEITRSNLHLPGLQHTPLTQVETSMLYEAMCRSQPQLGKRLLLPRYDVADTERSVHAVAMAISQGMQIPGVPVALWDYVLRHDYLRSSQETGPFAFFEADPQRSDNCFRYRYPTAPLPLDRLAESFFSQEDNEELRDFVPPDILNPVSDNECESSTETVASDVLERIRGGGRSLMNIADTDWVGKAVRSTCMTCKDGHSLGDTYFVGEVQGCEVELGLVRVLVFFTGNEGYLRNPQEYNFDASDLTSVSEEDPGMKLILLGRLVRTGCSCNERSGLLVHPQRSVEMSSLSSSVEHAGASLLRSLIVRSDKSTPLGFLPDGSAVFWFQSDPTAIYIQNRLSSWDSVLAEARVTFDSDLVKHSSEGIDRLAYYCPWGCCNPRGPRDRGSNRLRTIPYSTEGDLMSHISKQHLPVALHHDSPEINDLFRIEGRAIVALAGDISHAICARCPSLANFTTEISIDGEETNTLSLIMLDASENGRGSPRTLGPLMSTLRGKKSSLLRLLRLWSRIARLFDVNNGGLFRFSKDVCISQIQTSHGDSLFGKRGGSNELAIACLAGSRAVDTFAGSSVNCRVCGMVGEEPVKCYKAVPHGDEPNGTDRLYTSCPIGCALFSHVCLPDLPSTLQTLRHDLARAGDIGVAKAFLIHIASICQHSLKRVLKEPRQSVWEEGNYMNWRLQVEQARNLMSLSQAYIVLLRSIETEKLDAWWKNKSSGWNSPGVISRVPSFAGLLLHLFVFDLALTQYLCSSKTLPRSALRAVRDIPEGLRDMTLENRMKAVLEFASEIGRQPFDGASNNHCLQCDDGGTLLECEFCENVQHSDCSNPPVTDPENLEAWVCDSCMIDLWKAKESLSR